jgi:hypothetical protein
MANAVTGTLHGTTITLDAPVPALDGHRVRVVVEDASAQAESTSAAEAVKSALAELGPWEGESEEELRARLADARRVGGTRRVPNL